MHKTLLLLCAAAGCAMSEEETLSTVESEANVEQWDDGAWAGDQRSNYQVGLASYGGRLHMVYRTDDYSSGVHRPWLKWSRFNGTSWSEPVQLSLEADRGPSLTVHDDKLVVVYNSYGENRFLMSTSRGQEWTTPVTAGASLYTAKVDLAPSVVNYRNVLYLSYCKMDGAFSKVQIDRYNGYEWSSVFTYSLPYGYYCKSVAAAAMPGPRFRLIWNVVDPSSTWSVYEAYGSGVSQDLLTVRLLQNEYSAKPSSIVHCDGLTHWVHGGQSDPESMWWSFLENGRWVRSVPVPGHASYGGAQLACHGTRTFMVHNTRDTSRLRYSEFGP